MNVKYPLTKVQKEAWLEALRSTYFKQGYGYLSQVINGECYYCPLGVLNLLNGNQSEEIKILRIGKQALYIPFEMQANIMTMNDRQKKSFVEIADRIEKILHDL